MLPQYRDDYSKSRFEDAICEVLYRMALNGGADEEDGSVTETGHWHGLLWGPFEESHLIPSNTMAAILEEDSQGFVTYQLFKDPWRAQSKWNYITGYSPDIPARTLEAFEQSIRKVSEEFVRRLDDSIPQADQAARLAGLNAYGITNEVMDYLLDEAAVYYLDNKQLPINGLAAAVRKLMQKHYPDREFADLDRFVYMLRLAIERREKGIVA